VDPLGKYKGMLLLYNPTNRDITRSIQVPLYYTGLTETAVFREKEGKPISLKLNRGYEAALAVTIPAESYTWLTIE
jgi:hypothetical protein